MKMISAALVLAGLLLFTYGAIKLARSADEQIESVDGFSMELNPGQTQFGMKVSGAGLLMCGLGVATYLGTGKRRSR